MSGVRMRVLAASGGWVASAAVWMAAFDVHAHDGRGAAEYTTDPEEAYVWPDASAAMDDWRAIPGERPLREDGQPNRPLTALTIEIEAAP